MQMERSQKGFAFRNYLCDFCMAGIGKAASNMEMPAKALQTSALQIVMSWSGDPSGTGTGGKSSGGKLMSWQAGGQSNVISTSPEATQGFALASPSEGVGGFFIFTSPSTGLQGPHRSSSVHFPPIHMGKCFFSPFFYASPRTDSLE